MRARCWAAIFCLVSGGLHVPRVAAEEAAGGEQDSAGPSKVSRCASQVPSENPLAADYHEYEGENISGIRFVGVGVFDLSDPSENNFIYSFLNRFHSETRPSTIEPQLLFTPGQTINSSAISETERLLRALPYLGNAEITVDEVCPEGVALLVKTRDIWTFEPSFSFGREGGESKHGFGLSEENILGYGNAFAIGYSKTDDRSSISYAFHSPHLLSSRLTLDLAYTETTDGQQTYFSLQSPFYSLQTPWASGVEFSDITVQEKIRFKDETVDVYRHSEIYNEIYTGIALVTDAKETHRLSFGLSQERDDYEAVSETVSVPPANENLIYPWLEYRMIENQFAVYKNLNLMHQIEDISVGSDLTVRVGYAGKQYQNEFDAWRYLANFSNLLGIGDHHLMKYALTLDGRYYLSQRDLSRAVWGGGIGYHYLIGDKNRIYTSFQYHQGNNLLPHEELRVGGEFGLRGYPLDYQRGNRRYLMSVEKRYISDLHVFNLFRVGTVVYLDFGRAWSKDYPEAHHLSNIGFGLRFSSSKAEIGHVMHLDIAYPLADKQFVDKYQLVIKASTSL